MKKTLLAFFLLIGLNTLYAQEAEEGKQENTQENTQEKVEKQEEGMTHAQELWGRKFQASLSYTYFSSGHQGVDVGYGVWDHNKMGILADVFVPVDINKDRNKLYLISFFWVWDYTPIEWFSILPKIGYGAKILEQNIDGGKAYHLSWEPTMSLDLTFNLNSFVRLFASYTWAMYKDFSDEVNQLHGGSVGLRIAY